MRTYCVAQGTLFNTLSDPNGKEIQMEGDTCIRMADSFHCTVKINTTV